MVWHAMGRRYGEQIGVRSCRMFEGSRYIHTLYMYIFCFLQLDGGEIASAFFLIIKSCHRSASLQSSSSSPDLSHARPGTAFR